MHIYRIKLMTCNAIYCQCFTLFSRIWHLVSNGRSWTRCYWSHIGVSGRIVNTTVNSGYFIILLPHQDPSAWTPTRCQSRQWCSDRICQITTPAGTATTALDLRELRAEQWWPGDPGTELCWSGDHDTETTETRCPDLQSSIVYQGCKIFAWILIKDSSPSLLFEIISHRKDFLWNISQLCF